MSRIPLISIVISNYNGANLNILEDCLISFKKIDYPNYELILVDNASTDESLEIAKRILGKNPKFKIIQNKINMYSQGLNLGLRFAQGEYVAYFNNDVAIEKKYFHKLLEAFQKYPKLALAQGKLLWYFDHKIIDSSGETMDIFGNPVTLGYKVLDNGQFENIEEILSASGSACMLKKDIIQDVGVYDPNYGIGYEDMDLALRLRHKGYQVLRIPKALCYHKRGATDLSPLVRIKVKWHFNKNRLSTMIKNYPLPLLLKALPVTMLVYLSNILWEILVLRNVPLALTRPQAVCWVLQNFGYLISERRKIRANTTLKTDKKILKLFAKSDLLGKVKVVILDRFAMEDIGKKTQYLLLWTYPSEIKKLIPKGSSVLDIGCGDGHLMAWVNSWGDYKVVGIDINKKDLELAKKRMCSFTNGKPVYQQLIQADITKKFPLRKKFDIVLCSQVIEHLQKEKALKLIQNLEKLANKRIIIATTNGYFQFDHREHHGSFDKHLSGWSLKEFLLLGYKVSGHGLKLIYQPGGLKNILPGIFKPLLFTLSYLATPILHFIPNISLFLISIKNIKK